MRRIFTTGDGQGAKEESDAKTHLRARYTTPFKALGASRGSSRYCRAPQIRSTWPPSPYHAGVIASWGSVSRSPVGRVAVFARNGDATRPYGHTSPHAHARSLAAASPNPDTVLMRLEAQRSNVLELHSGPTAVDGRASVSSKLVEGGGARSWE